VFEQRAPWIEKIISISAVVATTSVLLVFQIGQPRIWMSMSRDGLLPKKFQKIHPRYRTPSFATIITGVLVGLGALFMQDGRVMDLTSIGTFFAFILVSGGVLMLPPRPKEPGKFHLPYINGQFIVPILLALFIYLFRERIGEALGTLRKTPGKIEHQELLFLVFLVIAVVIAVFTFIRKHSFIPIMGVLSCLYLMIEIPTESWFWFVVWMAIGFIIYFSYGRKNSLLVKSGEAS